MRCCLPEFKSTTENYFPVNEILKFPACLFMCCTYFFHQDNGTISSACLQRIESRWTTPTPLFHDIQSTGNSNPPLKYFPFFSDPSDEKNRMQWDYYVLQEEKNAPLVISPSLPSVNNSFFSMTRWIGMIINLISWTKKKICISFNSILCFKKIWKKHKPCHLFLKNTFFKYIRRKGEHESCSCKFCFSW